MKEKMQVVSKAGHPDIASVYIARTGENKYIEFVESVNPPLSVNDKWVNIISTLYGCPVKCKFCDAGLFYQGKIPYDLLKAQIDYLIKNRFSNNTVPVKKYKIQFARMGEPTLNEDVLQLLEDLPSLYSSPGLIPSFSTIAPIGKDLFFRKLLDIKNRHYSKNFQMQFSVHSTDNDQRDELIPVKKWDLNQIRDYGDIFHREGERKITLNFSVSETSILDSRKIIKLFNREKFLIKITPVNPTFHSKKNNIHSYDCNSFDSHPFIKSLRKADFDVIISVGEPEENNIGSNCGQHILHYMKKNKESPFGFGNDKDSYTYDLVEIGK